MIITESHGGVSKETDMSNEHATVALVVRETKSRRHAELELRFSFCLIREVHKTHNDSHDSRPPRSRSESSSFLKLP